MSDWSVYLCKLLALFPLLVIIKIRNDKGKIITDIKEIYNVIRKYFKNLYFIRLEKLNEMYVSRDLKVKPSRVQHFKHIHKKQGNWKKTKSLCNKTKQTKHRPRWIHTSILTDYEKIYD